MSQLLSPAIHESVSTALCSQSLHKRLSPGRSIGDIFPRPRGDRPFDQLNGSIPQENRVSFRLSAMSPRAD
jgi:hypothetical protein